MPDYFRLISFRIIDERRFNARNQQVTLSEATIKVEVGGAQRMIVAEGNGPVNALDVALRQALSATFPALEHMHLADYKVRILTPDAGTAAVTRVIIESVDDEARRWSTVGVSTNAIDASYNALHDSITYKLLVDGAPRRPALAASRPPRTRPSAAPVVILGARRLQLGENIGTSARAMLNFGLDRAAAGPSRNAAGRASRRCRRLPARPRS